MIWPRLTPTAPVNRGRRAAATCESCHSDDAHPITLQGGKPNDHTDKAACQTCHIPEFARGGVATKTYWDWSTAGRMGDDGKVLKLHEFTPSDGVEMYTYLSTKGGFEWGENVVPYYIWFNGPVGYTTRDATIDPVNVFENNHISGEAGDPDSRIWLFKRMLGRQAYDSVFNRLAFTHVWGPDTDTAFWINFDWGKAVEAGMKAAGAAYSGEFGFVDTHMYWPITHMVAPAEDPFSPVGLLGMLMVLGTLAGVIGHGPIRKIATKKRSMS